MEGQSLLGQLASTQGDPEGWPRGRDCSPCCGTGALHGAQRPGEEQGKGISNPFTFSPAGCTERGYNTKSTDGHCRGGDLLKPGAFLPTRADKCGLPGLRVKLRLAQRRGTAPCSPVRAQRMSQQTLLGPEFSKASFSFQTGARGNLLYKRINVFYTRF